MLFEGGVGFEPLELDRMAIPSSPAHGVPLTQHFQERAGAHSINTHACTPPSNNTYCFLITRMLLTFLFAFKPLT